jgi:hypothetical protein
MENLTCNGPCTHDEYEHAAFDQGVGVGLAGGAADANPYIARPDRVGYPFLREAWATGHSAGRLQYQESLNNPPFACDPED